MLKIRKETIVRPLKKGDSFRVAASSSVVDNQEEILEGLKVLEGWGLNCIENKVFGREWGYLAGKDSERALELYKNDSSKLVIFAKGGWGAARLLGSTNRWNNGWFLGYSDITSLIFSRTSNGFHGSVHGPMLNSISKEPEWSKDRLRALLFGEKLPDLYGESWNSGIAKGPLIAANLTVGTHLIGTNHMPNLKGSILILEDIGEEPYRIDRMLTHWRLTGLLNDVAGIGFGIFKHCAPKDIHNQRTFDIKQILKDRTMDLGIPVIGGLPIGHIQGNAAMPIGHMASINGNQGKLRIIY